MPDGSGYRRIEGDAAMNAVSSAPLPVLEAEILGLEPGETDPVRIILAAQLRLRLCRRDHPCGERPASPVDVRQIVAARDALLRRAVGVLAGRGLRGCVGQACSQRGAGL